MNPLGKNTAYHSTRVSTELNEDMQYKEYIEKYIIGKNYVDIASFLREEKVGFTKVSSLNSEYVEYTTVLDVVRLGTPTLVSTGPDTYVIAKREPTTGEILYSTGNSWNKSINYALELTIPKDSGI